MPLPKLLATCALAVLVASIALLVMGFNEAQRKGEERNGLRTIPSESEFVRSLLDTPLADDLGEVNATVWLLRAASRRDDAEGLSRYFIHCNVQRVLAQDDACRSDTVRSAIGKGRSLRVNSADRSSAPETLVPTLAGALSFRLPDEQALLATIHEGSRKDVRYDGPGVLRHADRDGGYLFVAATNETAWTIARFESRLTVAPPGASAIELNCSNDNPFPFSTRVAEPAGEVTAYCRPPDDIPFEQVIAAIRDVQSSDMLGMGVALIDFRDPYVRVIDGGERAVPRFVLEPIVRLFLDGRDLDIATREAQLPRELAAVDCEKLGTCRSAVPSFVLGLLDEHVHPLTLPPFFGTLLGAIIGGFARRPLTFGGVFIASLMTVAAIGIGGLIGMGGGETGFVLMGAAMLASGAVITFALGVPAFFVALVLVRALHAKPSSP